MLFLTANSPWWIYSKGPEFFFAGQPVHRPRYTVFHRRNQPNQFNPDAQPLIGYLDYLDVTGLRAKRLKPRTRRDKGHDTVGARIFTKKLSRVTPAEWTEDRYFLCVLLSIAQLQERFSKDSSTPSFLVCTKVNLLLQCRSENLTYSS